jgi:diguanylate cyclase (GGDEF)-like protein
MSDLRTLFASFARPVVGDGHSPVPAPGTASPSANPASPPADEPDASDPNRKPAMRASASLAEQDKRRASVSHLLRLLIAGALGLALLAGALVFVQLAHSGESFEQKVIETSWRNHADDMAKLLGTLAQQDPANAPRIASALQTISGSDHATVRLDAGARATPAYDYTTLGGQVFLRLQAPLDSARHAVALVAIDAPMRASFARDHVIDGMVLSHANAVPYGYNSIALNAPGQGTIGRLAWISVGPTNTWMQQLPATVLVMLALFALGAWFIMRRSATIANELIASEARARHLAFHDVLTGLPNRAMMFDRLRQMLAIGRRYDGDVAVHCLDLDRFKEVNDTLGHPAGDELIQQVSQRLIQLCRESDTVARLGGDEFVILQPETTAAGASHLAERVLKMFEEPFELQFGVVEVGVSIGSALITNLDIDPHEALRQADLALYGSKENGRNRVTFFEPDMDAALRMRRALETDLRKALADGELEMVYQPQMNTDGQIGAMEALVRWTHAEKGAIPPAVFVPLCEETGLILDLGEFVMERVFKETAHWLTVRVAINVSPLQLRSPMFMAMVTRLVAQYGVDPARYEMEITETALLGDDGVTRDNLLMLKQEGFTIALDDFGTGYSSLNSLKRFSVDKIKIDRSFVHNLEADIEAEALVDAIVKLGKAMKLAVVAEGVETQGQRDRLTACGCSTIQGYLVSRPVPADQLDGLFYG